MTEPPLRVLLADDHEGVRASIRALLEAEADADVVGEAESGTRAVEMTLELKPDVVIMDLSMPGLNGLEATRRIVALGLDTRVLILTVHGEEEYLIPVVDAGASGYVPKISAHRDLVDAVAVVGRGEVYLPPKATRLILDEYRNSDDAAASFRELSPREQEVLALTAEGYSSREVGEKLFISPKTVETHRARIMGKLGLGHRSELVRFALRVGLLQDV